MRKIVFQEQENYNKIENKLLFVGWSIFASFVFLFALICFLFESLKEYKIAILCSILINLLLIGSLFFLYFLLHKKRKSSLEFLKNNFTNTVITKEQVFENFARFGNVKQISENKYYILRKKLGVRYKIIFIVKDDLQKNEINGKGCFAKINELENLDEKVNFWASMSSIIIFLTNKLTPDLEEKLNRNNDNLMRRKESITLCSICFEEKKFYVQPHLGLEGVFKYRKNIKILNQYLQLKNDENIINKIEPLSNISKDEKIKKLYFDDLAQYEKNILRLFYNDETLERIIILKHNNIVKYVKERLDFFDEEEMNYFNIDGVWDVIGGVDSFFADEKLALNELNKELEKYKEVSVNEIPKTIFNKDIGNEQMFVMGTGVDKVCENNDVKKEEKPYFLADYRENCFKEASSLWVFKILYYIAVSLFLGLTLIFIIVMERMDMNGLKMGSIEITVLVCYLLSFVFLVFICVLYAIKIKQSDNIIIKKFGKVDADEFNYKINTEYEISFLDSSIKRIKSKLNFNKEAICIGNYFKYYWKNIVKIEIFNNLINIHTTYDGNGIVLPLNEVMYKLIKTFYNKEIENEGDASKIFIDNEKKGTIIYKNSQMIKSIIIISVILTLTCSLYLVTALPLFYKYKSEIFLIIAMIPALIFSLISGVFVLKNLFYGSIKIYQDKIILTERHSVTAIKLEEISLIKYNDKYVKIQAKNDIVYPKLIKLKKCLQEIALSKKIKFEQTSEILYSRKNNLTCMMENHYLSFTYKREFFIDGVNIFDFYSNYTKSKKTILIISKDKEHNYYNALINYFIVKGQRVEFEVGIAVQNDIYVIYMDNSQFIRKGAYFFKDCEINTKNKIEFALQLEQEKQEEYQKVIYSINGMTRATIKLIANFYYVKIQKLELFEEEYSSILVFADVYFWEEVGRPENKFTSLEQAISFSKEEVEKEFQLKTSLYKIMKNESKKLDLQTRINNLSIILSQSNIRKIVIDSARYEKVEGLNSFEGIKCYKELEALDDNEKVNYLQTKLKIDNLNDFEEECNCSRAENGNEKQRYMEIVGYINELVLKR